MAADNTFWLALGEIVWINVLLSGDNAVVIALACRSLPQGLRKWGILLGVGPAIILRVVFTTFVGTLLSLPFLKIVGAVLLLWIAVSLLLPRRANPAMPTSITAACGRRSGPSWSRTR